MKTHHFIQKLDHARITAAIVEAERGTSGQIRVYVSHRARANALEAARARFAKLGLEKTAGRNAVLIYLAPEAHKFAVMGDQGIHEKGGDDFWQKVVGDTMRPMLKEGKFTEAIVAAVGQIGRELAAHFPAAAGDLRDDVADGVEED